MGCPDKGGHFGFVNRILSFLKGEFVVMNGESINTDVYIESTAPMMLYSVPVFVVVGLVSYLTEIYYFSIRPLQDLVVFQNGIINLINTFN